MCVVQHRHNTYGDQSVFGYGFGTLCRLNCNKATLLDNSNGV